MDTFLYLGLSNALLATVLALFAAPVTRVCRRPALAHALWLLVLLRLLAPPLLPVPIPGLHDLEPARSAEESIEPEQTAILDTPAPPAEEAPVASAAAAEPAATAEEQPPPAPASFVLTWQAVVLSVWLLGSLAWWLLAAWRLRCFRRVLHHAQVAPGAIQEQARRLAGLLGLRRCPRVWLVPAPISPMLLALGTRPRLLLPAALWEQLSPAQQDAILTHELAHLRRGDPWVRHLELLVLGLYWWLPVAWWARRRLQEVEEQCCDAWVVWALPGSGPDYAAALVETLTFLSPVQGTVPLGASGAGQVPLLKRRLIMILRGDSPRSLSRRSFWALVALAALLLALAPRGAHTEPPRSAPEPVRDESVPARPRKLRPEDRNLQRVHPHKRERQQVCATCHEALHQLPAKAEYTDDWRHAHDEVVRLIDQVKRTEAALRKAEANLNRLLDRKNDRPKGGATKQAPSPPRIRLPNGLVLKSAGNVEKNPGASTRVVWELINTSGEVVQISQIRSSSDALTVTPTSLRLEPGQSRRLVARLDTGRFSGVKTFTLLVTFDKPRPGEFSEFKFYLQGTGQGTENAASTAEDNLKQRLDRLERLEKGLDRLMLEVESLRRELRRPTPSPTKEDEVRKWAEKDFQTAEHYRRTGNPASAVMYYEMVRRRYPGSSLAEKAGVHIKELQSKMKAK